MDLRIEYERLQNRDRGGLTPQARGQQFEVFLKALLNGMDPRIRIRPDGEEIDGSFAHRDRYFLLEAKWRRKPLPASAIYAFKGKVDGKLAGTLGVFVSMSGYSRDAVDALRVGKALNVILFTAPDIESAIEDGFGAVLDFKLRAATETGDLMVEYERVIAKPHGARVLAFVVEGAADAYIIRSFGEMVRSANPGGPEFTVVSASGRLGLGPVASALARTSPNTKVAVVTDLDPDEDESDYLAALRRDAAVDDVSVIAVRPSLEAWVVAGVPSWDGARPIPDIAPGDLHRVLAGENGFREFVGLLTS
jgi:Restriction endonuclease